MVDVLEPYLGIKYKLKSSENFDEYLKYIGVGVLSRKIVCAVNPVNTLTREGDIYTFTMRTAFRTVTFSFKFDEEFVEERPDGCQLKAIATIEDGNFIHTQVESNGRKSKHVRTFTPEVLTVITTAEGWEGECIRIYEAIP